MAFMFSALDSKEKAIVVDAMSEKKAVPGDVIIKQGDEGDALYVVESGTLSCFKLFAGKTE
jgi:cAMP-dependent protein kinase regulator